MSPETHGMGAKTVRFERQSSDNLRLPTGGGRPDGRKPFFFVYNGMHSADLEQGRAEEPPWQANVQLWVSSWGRNPTCRPWSRAWRSLRNSAFPTSAHRKPAEVHDWASGAHERGIRVIIAAAGKAAHLGGVVAAYTPNPVICVPMKTSDLGGLDSLLSMVQMPSGVPVACVAINGAKNAAILAVQMLGTGCEECRQKIIDFKQAMAEA